MSSLPTYHFSNHNDDHYQHRTHSPFYSTPIPQHQTHSQPTQRAHIESTAYNQALALLHQQAHQSTNPGIDASGITDHNQARSSASLLPSIWAHAPASTSQVDPLYTPQQESWSRYQNQQGQQGQYRNSPLGTPVSRSSNAAKRAYSHQRTSSASTVASAGPASPFSYNTLFPQVAQPEYTPHSPAADFWDLSGSQADQSSNSFSKYPLSQNDSFFLSAPGYMPSHAAHTPPAHLAMKGFAIDHHNLEDLPSEVTHSSRQSMSSVGQDSPATPRSTAEDADNKPVKTNSNEYRQANPNVQLHRTESAAYQDELYNPANFVAAPSSAPKTNNNFLTPHRNLVNERLQTANIARSVSPSSVSRERSPFRHGSPLAPAQDAWNSPRVGTQAGMRQQQKEETAQAEIAQHRPALKREPTKTISPKDALLDYTDTDQTPLFQDTIPTGYKQHFGGTEQFPPNFFSQGNAAFVGGVPTSQPNMTSFRATNSADAMSGGNFNLSSSGQVQPPFQAGQYQQSNNNNMNSSYPATSLTEPTPDFPAHLTSMESSMSEGPGASSQEGNSLPVQRPDDTRANTGTYTCTYHGCTQRFESQPALQKHKRDFHRSQAHNNHNRDSGAESGVTSVSPSSPGGRSTGSSEPSEADESGMTSAALLARNSQAGPHKCSRINPSTGKPCNTVFSRPYDLTRHEDTIHNNRKMKVRCPHCREEKTFSRNDALTRHMRVVHPEADSYGKRGRHD